MSPAHSSLRSLGATLFVAVALAAVVVVAQPEPAPPLNHDPAVGYVGRESCKLCHFARATTYAEVGMGRSFYPLSADNLVEDWTDRNEIAHPTSGLRYRLYRSDGRFFAREFQLDGDGAEIAASDHELSYVVGSNNHGRGYIEVRDGRLFQTPACWDDRTTQWIFCPGYEGVNVHFTREIDETCVFCHNGRMVLEQNATNRYEAVPHGIGCERCHGPGQLHVERWMQGDRTPPGEPDPTIVNPRNLSIRLREQVCFQCHLGDTNGTERVRRHDRRLLTYRPGQPLTEVIVPFRYVQQTEHDFGLVAQADRMVLSRCYTESDGKMECLTCHDPHVSVYREGRPEGYFRARCLQCHTNDSCTASDRARGATEPADDCVGCHMRSGEPTDRHYSLFTDHWIRKTLPDEVDRRTDFTMEPVFPEAFERMPPGEQAYYRARAEYLQALQIPQPGRQIQWQAAEADFREAIATGYDTTYAWFFLGKTLGYLGRIDEARRAIETAVERDPANRDAAFALGQAAAGSGELGRAEAIFAALVERNPEDALALAEYGRVLFGAGRADEALEAYDRAAALAPWTPSVQLNRGRILASLGRMDEAVAAAEQVVRSDPDGYAAWEFYASVMQATGNAAERDRAAEILRSGRLTR